MLKKALRKFASNSPRGFTLIEILVVLGILGILAGILIISAASIQRTARDAQSRADLAKIQAAIQEFYVDQGRYPAVMYLDVEDRIDSCIDQRANTDLAQGQLDQANCRADIVNPPRVYLPRIPRSWEQRVAIANGDFATANVVHYCYQAQISRTDPGRCSLTSSPIRCNYYHLYARLETGDQAFPLGCTPQYAQSIVHHENYEVTPDTKIDNTLP